MAATSRFARFASARTAGEFYRDLASRFREALGAPPRLALFACSDEAETQDETSRARAFAATGGVFVTQMVGGQVFRGQLDVALARGHASNAFEVNVHVGVERDGETLRYGVLRGRDGVVRPTCGAMRHVIDDFVMNPGNEPRVSHEVDGELVLDFIATLAYRMRPRFEEIRNDTAPMLRAALVNVDVQVEACVKYLRRMAPAAAGAACAVAGTLSWNEEKAPPRISLLRFVRLRPPGFGPEEMPVTCRPRGAPRSPARPSDR